MTYTDTGGHGAASELIACAYFLKKGWYVYRSQGQHAPFDLVLYREGQVIRVEVKSVSITEGRNTKSPGFAWPVNDQWDWLALVLPDGQVMTFHFGTTKRVAREAVRAVLGLPQIVRNNLGHKVIKETEEG